MAAGSDWMLALDFLRFDCAKCNGLALRARFSVVIARRR
jgi:hypothetical protein